MAIGMIEKRRSRIQGWGVFATQPINKNTRIVDYAGEKVTNRESLKREVRYLKQGHIWCFKLNRLYARDAAVGRQRRTLHQSFVPAQLLRAGHRPDDLDSRGAQHPPR